MKIVLASQGFTTREIAKAVSDLVGKPIGEMNVAVINEAYVGISAGRHEGWLINELSQIAQYSKLVSFVNLRAYNIEEIKRRLEFADLIYIVGGVQVVLPKLFKETGFDKLLVEIAETKVLMGTSAGANVLGKQIEDANYWENQYGKSEEFLANPSLGIVPFNILPHFERGDHPYRTTEKLTPLLKDHPFKLYGVNDTQAVIFDDGQIEFAGGKPAIFGN